MLRPTHVRASVRIFLCLLVFPVTHAEAACLDYLDFLHWTGSISMSSFEEDMARAGDFLYLGGHDFQVVDVSNPGSPAVVGTLDTAGETTHIAVSGSLVYLADGPLGLQVVDVSLPNSPTVIGALDVGSYAADLVLSGSLAYVLTREAGLVVVDVSNPSAPVAVGGWPSAELGLCLSMVDGYLYVLRQDDFVSDLSVLDLSSPTAPVEIANVPSLFEADAFWEADIARHDDALFLSHPLGSPTIIDVSNPASPVAAGTLPVGASRDIYIHGDRAFVCEYENGITVLDLSAWPAATETGALLAPENSYGSIVVGDQLLVVDGDSYLDLGRLHVAALGNLASPASIGALAPPGTCYGLALSNSLLLLAQGTSGVSIVDASAPSAPALLAALDTPGTARQISMSGPLALVADGFEGMAVVDVSTPSLPHLLSSFDTAGETRQVRLLGSRAYLAAGTSGMIGVDLSNPSAPSLASSTGIPGLCRSLAIDGSIAAVASSSTTTSDGTLRLYDLSTPTPILLGAVTFDERAIYADWHQGRVYVLTGDAALGRGRLRIIDVTSPAAPVEIGSAEVSGFPTGLTFDDELVYVASTEFQRGTVQVFSLINPTAPLAAGDLAYRTDLGEVQVSDGLLYAARTTGGLEIRAARCTTASAEAGELRSSLELSAMPNPSRGPVTFRLAVPVSSGHTRVNAELSILDPRGRRLRRETIALTPSGQLAWSWDGLDAAGRAVPNGVYFARVAVDSQAATRTVQLLRSIR